MAFWILICVLGVKTAITTNPEWPPIDSRMLTCGYTARSIKTLQHRSRRDCLPQLYTIFRAVVLLGKIKTKTKKTNQFRNRCPCWGTPDFVISPNRVASLLSTLLVSFREREYFLFPRPDRHSKYLLYSALIFPVTGKHEHCWRLVWAGAVQ
jgi:hypothetical protein